jgi:hypothetical protein
MAGPPFNCSVSSLSARYAFNPSRTAADALSTCYELLDAKCTHMGLDASYCSSSQSNATGEKVFSSYKSTFCYTHYNNTDAFFALAFGAPIALAFLLNTFRLVVRAPQETRARVSEPAVMRMVDPLAEASLHNRVVEEDYPRRSDSMGALGRVLPFVGLHWIRAPKASRTRQALRICFLLWTVLVFIPLCLQDGRLYFARYSELTFVLTYNKCSTLCKNSGGVSCSQPFDTSFNCEASQDMSVFLNYLECFEAGKLDLLVRSGFAVQLLLLLLPLHSAVSCAFEWPRPDNRVLLALDALRQLSPDNHHRCTIAATKFIFLLAIVLATLSVTSTQLYNRAFLKPCDSRPCPSLNVALVDPKLTCHVFIYAFLSLTPIAMVSLFAFTAFITRLRMRAFVSIAEFVGTSVMQRSDSLHPSSRRAPVASLGAQDVLIALQLCRCPDVVISKCRALLLVEGGNGYRDAAFVLQSHLRLLWTIQLRDIESIAQFGQRWLIAQTLFALGLLLPIAAFLSLASQYPALLVIVLPILQLYFLFCIPFVAAISALAIGCFYVHQACEKLSLLLDVCSQQAESNTDDFEPAYRGQDSLASIVTFCRFTSQDAFSLYGIQINWKSLAQFVYYMGLAVWVLSSSLIGAVSTRVLQ